MTVRKAATFGFDEGKGVVRAASGVVAPHREFHPPAPEGEWMSGCGSIRPSGWPRALADVVGALPALQNPAALAVQGEALQQVSMQGVQARATGAARQDFVKPSNKPETDWGRFGRQGQNWSKGTRQHRIPASSKEKPADAAGGRVLNAAPTGNTAIKQGDGAVNWSGLPGQGGAEKGEKRPARRRVWPVAPGVPASTREAARARHGEGAALIMRHARVTKNEGSGRQFGRQLLELLGCQVAGQHGQDVGTCRKVQAEHDGAVDQRLRLNTQLVGARLQAASGLEADLPAAVVAELGKAPRRHGYAASGKALTNGRNPPPRTLDAAAGASNLAVPQQTNEEWKCPQSSSSASRRLNGASRSLAVLCRAWPCLWRPGSAAIEHSTNPSHTVFRLGMGHGKLHAPAICLSSWTPSCQPIPRRPWPKGWPQSERFWTRLFMRLLSQTIERGAKPGTDSGTITVRVRLTDPTDRPRPQRVADMHAKRSQPKHHADPADHADTSPWMTRTSCRSGRSSATGTTPRESLSKRIANSAGHSSAPLSSALIRALDRSPRREAIWPWVQPIDFRKVAGFIDSEVRIFRTLSQGSSFGFLETTRAADCSLIPA